MGRPDPIVGAPVELFEFLRVLEVAGHRRKLTRMVERVARLAAFDSDGTTGQHVVVNVERIAAELGISDRQVWQHFGTARDLGWFTQTQAPARGKQGVPGRRARYCCTVPPLDLGLPGLPDDDLWITGERVQDPRAEPADDTTGERVKVARSEPAHVDEEPAETSAGFGGERVRVLGQNVCRNRAQDPHSPTSDGSTSDGSTTPVVGLGAQPQDARAMTNTEPDSRDQPQTTPTEPAPPAGDSIAAARAALLAARAATQEDR